MVARAQQSTRVSKIGVLWPGVTFPPPPRMEAFRQALRQLGYVEGQNIAIELRYAEGGPQQLPNLAAERQTWARLGCPLSADCVAKVESCRATNFSRNTTWAAIADSYNLNRVYRSRL